MGDGIKQLIDAVEFMHDEHLEHLGDTICGIVRQVVELESQIEKLQSIRDRLNTVRVQLQLEYPE